MPELPLSPGRALPLAVIGAALICIFMTALYQRLEGPGLALEAAHNHPAQMPAQETPQAAQAPQAPQLANPLSEADAAMLGALMSGISANPRDRESYLAIAGIFERNNDPVRAEIFRQRAAQLEESAIMP